MKTSETWNSLQRLLGAITEPATITFSETLPAGMARIENAAPAGCVYWKLAADGRAFYTIGADHLNCPVGAYTHGAELTSDAKGQLDGVIQKMIEIRYLKAEEVPKIPHRTQALSFVVYAPLSKVEGTPDVVLLRGNAKQVMLFAEAAQACGALSPSHSMGRPACAVIAATIDSGKAETSWGCIGNRVYTGLPDTELYVGVPGRLLGEVVETLTVIAGANAELQEYHQAKCACA